MLQQYINIRVIHLAGTMAGLICGGTFLLEYCSGTECTPRAMLLIVLCIDRLAFATVHSLPFPFYETDSLKGACNAIKETQL